MSCPHHYVECDVPEGMTLRDYRAAKREPAEGRRGGLVARLRAVRRARRTPAQPARSAA